MIYFDNAATTPMHPEVIETMHQKMHEFYGNPSSSHAAGRKVKSEIEYARRSIAKCMGCEPGEIYFTSGGTESDNIVLHNASALGCQQIITSKIEHHAVLHTAQEIEKTGMAVKYVNLTKLGHVNINHLEELLKSAPKSMVSLMHANNENGEDVNELINEIGIEFDKALENDLNTHLALSAFFKLVKEANRLAAEENLGKENTRVINSELKRMREILGLHIPEITDKEKNEINEMITQREQSRKEKQFEEADKIRDKLNEMNVELIDHKGKTIWMRKEKIKVEK